VSAVVCADSEALVQVRQADTDINNTNLAVAGKIRERRFIDLQVGVFIAECCSEKFA